MPASLWNPGLTPLIQQWVSSCTRVGGDPEHPAGSCWSFWLWERQVRKQIIRQKDTERKRKREKVEEQKNKRAEAKGRKKGSGGSCSWDFKGDGMAVGISSPNNGSP